ncbi:hypothetical protein [Flavobacterium tructae]|uniref:hypothetical protein n=1 Tax=Flavobacterium tructae TaxID=1114873 RepID=UPI0035A9122F
MINRYKVSTNISSLQYFVVVVLLFLAILASFKGYKILSFIFSLFFFYKAYKIYLKNKNKITELEINENMIRLFNYENRLVFQAQKELLSFTELENGLIKIQSRQKENYHLDLGTSKNEIKMLIGEHLFEKSKKSSFFNLGNILDFLDIIR